MVVLYLLRNLVALCVKYPYVALAVVALIVASVLLGKLHSTSSVKIETTRNIDATANQILSIRDLRQWEALSVECEEMVDTTEKHIFGNKSLVRIYTGTLRIGIDMSSAPRNWFTARGDTAFLRLPPVVLLNPEFINEARTRTFSENGKWDAAVYEALYQKARIKMLQRSFGIQQRQQAQQNIEEKFESMFRAFGYKEVVVEWQKNDSAAAPMRHTEK